MVDIYFNAIYILNKKYENTFTARKMGIEFIS